MTAPVSDKRELVADWVRQHGGQRTLQRILVASNGIAALKCIRSIRRFSYETFGTESAFHFIVMATPEDVKANAEYIHMADQLVEVPGGTNNNNYANIHLITEIAISTRSDAVWAGWGHASENPELADALLAVNVQWIGPTSDAMRALGDKVSSTLIAQSANVKCLPWSGSKLELKYVRGQPIDPTMYRKACAASASEAEKKAESIGFPVMIKASAGGGGKGIRNCTNSSEVAAAFRAVQAEVPGSPVFLMRTVTNVRHLEVQLLADEWGNAISVFGRDCSIQRRHQKIIEEGPVIAAPPARWQQMERCAVTLAKAVGYIGAGTVEYLYDEAEDEFAFLELNPRLQVEHPVTELISGVNLPAAQFQIAMGVPLHQISDIRKLFITVEPTGPIDFDSCVMVRPAVHVIACRITAENPDKGFQPTSGTLEDLNFRSTPHVWGYFSIGSRGGVHEFADSQFGHIFAVGSNREHARLHMSMALKELSVRGEINTTVEYLQSILETENFKTNAIHTRWLETQTQTKHVVTRPTDRNAVLLSASYLAWHAISDARTQFLTQIERGRLVDLADTEGLQSVNVTLRYQSFKYNVLAFLTGSSTMSLRLGEYCYGPVSVRELNASKGLLLTFEGRTYSVYGHSGRPLRVSISGQTVVFVDEFDPTCVRSQMSGKLLRYVVKDGDHAAKGDIVAEMEVMKMYIPVLMPADGVTHQVVAAGNNVAVGDILIQIDLDDPSACQQCVFPDFVGPFDDGDSRLFDCTYTDPEQVLVNCLDGFDLDWESIKAAFASFMQQMRDPLLPLRSVRSALSTLNGRLEGSVLNELLSNADQYQQKVEQKRFPWEKAPEFPADQFLSILDRVSSLDQCSQLHSLRDLLQKYSGGSVMRSVRSLDALLRRFHAVEEEFSSQEPSEVVIQTLLGTHLPDYVAQCIIAHQALPSRCRLIMLLLEALEHEMWPLVPFLKPTLTNLASLRGRFEKIRISLAARRLITRSQMPPLQDRCLAVRVLLEAGNPLVVTDNDITDCLLQIIDTSSAFPSLRSSAFQVYAKRYHHTSVLTSTVETPDGAPIAVFDDGNVIVWMHRLKMLHDVASHIFSREIRMLSICFMSESPKIDDDQIADEILSCISALQPQLNGCRVSFAVIGRTYLPRYFTYSLAAPGAVYREERQIRGLEPSLAPYLELDRLSSYQVTPIRAVHRSVCLYSATQSGSQMQPRLFARCVARLTAGLCDSRASEMHRDEAEAVLQDALQSIELACDRDQYRDNHVFLNFIVQTDINDHQMVLMSLFQRYSAALTRCRVTSAEVRIELTAPDTSRAVRYVCTNTTGLILLVEIYSEDESSPPNFVWHRSLHICTKGEQSGKIFQTDSECDLGDLHGRCCLTPYPIRTDIDRRRRIAQSVHTLLPYDFMSLFTFALCCDSRAKGLACPPFTAIELCRIEDSPNRDDHDAERFPSLRAHGLCAVKRPMGSNTIGMVAWLCQIYSAVHSAFRDVIIIANDITHQMGTFGVAEDELFLRCSRFARSEQLPRFFIAGNSGARIGLASELERIIKVDWVDDCDHRKGFNYLYIDVEDRDRVGDSIVTTTVSAELREGAVETRYRVDAIIGQQKGLGVENLAGSGSIAGETSAAYNDVFTLSYVSTRSVGIGAYLVRLGQRVIQKQGGFAPIILTGFGALNKVLGSSVYKSNRQLGGSELMAGNGITHQIVADDLEGVRSMLAWLEYVPLDRWSSNCGAPLHSLMSSCDPVDRPMPSALVDNLNSSDPRIFLTGDNSRGILGLFDNNSWVEYLKDWARTAITGRARIGGIAVGVVAVETRSQHKITPPDPVFPESQKSLRNQPGCVLFPDSAFKVAQSIRDFMREGLPIIIMANWRGFSGGQKDMHDEVLKYGAMIVDALQECKVPIIVYLPPNSELRGGAWVVVDRNVNRNFMEMYADPSSRGGVLEPAGIVDVKFRKAKLEALISRLNPELLKDPERLSASRSVYVSVAEKFADLHDTPVRMEAVGAINGVLSWRASRSFLYWRIRRRMIESAMLQKTSRAVLLHTLDLPLPTVDIIEIDLLRMVFGRIANLQIDFNGHHQDEQIVEWLQKNEKKIKDVLNVSRVQLDSAQLLNQMDTKHKLALLRRLQEELQQEQENMDA